MSPADAILWLATSTHCKRVTVTYYSAAQVCILREDILKNHTSFLGMERRCHAICTSASTSLFGLLSSRISPGPLSASWQAACLMPWCYGTVLTVAAWRCKAELWFQHYSSGIQWRCLAVVEHDISKELDWMWRVDCMAPLVPGT